MIAWLYHELGPWAVAVALALVLGTLAWRTWRSDRRGSG